MFYALLLRFSSGAITASSSSLILRRSVGKEFSVSYLAVTNSVVKSSADTCSTITDVKVSMSLSQPLIALLNVIGVSESIETILEGCRTSILDGFFSSFAISRLGSLWTEPRSLKSSSLRGVSTRARQSWLSFG